MSLKALRITRRHSDARERGTSGEELHPAFKVTHNKDVLEGEHTGNEQLQYTGQQRKGTTTFCWWFSRRICKSLQAGFAGTFVI